MGHHISLGARPSTRRNPPGIDGVLGVRALGCQRVRFDIDRGEFGWSR
jgi:hypothetical protein